MRLLRIMMPVVLAAGTLLAQDKALTPLENASDFDAVIIPVKTLSGDSFNRLVRLLQVFKAQMQADDKLRTIVVYAPRDVIEKMRKVVAQLDQPGSEAAIGRNVEMTLTFLKCSTKAPAQVVALPADMEAVAKQIRASTQYKGVELWDAVPLHLQEGKDSQEDLRMPGGAMGNLQIHPDGVVKKDQGRYVQFSRFSVTFNLPVQNGNVTQFQHVSLSTSGDFMEGQKTVLGKVSGSEDDSSVFVVISLKILD